MGADYYAHAVIGIEIDQSQIPTETQRPGTQDRKTLWHFIVKIGKHNHPTTISFDPKTGQKLWEDQTIPLISFEDGDMENGLDCYYTTDFRRLIVGWGVRTESNRTGDDVGFLKLPNIETVKKHLKNLLEPHKLWDEKKFGLYAELYCSY